MTLPNIFWLMPLLKIILKNEFLPPLTALLGHPVQNICFAFLSVNCSGCKKNIYNIDMKHRNMKHDGTGTFNFQISVCPCCLVQFSWYAHNNCTRLLGNYYILSLFLLSNLPFCLSFFRAVCAINKLILYHLNMNII